MVTRDWLLGSGEWGVGSGDWGLGSWLLGSGKWEVVPALAAPTQVGVETRSRADWCTVTASEKP